MHALRAETAALVKNNDNLHVFISYEQVKDEETKGKDYHHEGRLDLNTVPPDFLPKEADYYLCGPAPFMKEQYHALLGQGIARERIHSEAFGTGGVSL